MRARWIALGAATVLTAAAGALWSAAAARPVPVAQPIPFSHRAHVKGQQMECKDCHRAATEARAGFADIRACYECHKEPQGPHPDEAQARVKEYGKARQQIPWIQVNRLPGHVYFSHRAHVTFGGMKCEECHGDMSERSEPVSVPNLKPTTMNDCISCHRSRGATLQCADCHD